MQAGQALLGGTDLISYAQALEDVMLWRVMTRVHHADAFYIDVGAYHPVEDSVTKVFYDHGWRGLNVEASPKLFRAFEELRPDEINICAAVSDRSGEATFHEIVGHQLGTVVDKFADRHSDAGFERVSYTVPAVTLTQICEEHVKDQIHFLKIDVEGHENAVVAGMDFRRFRPWVMIIEATEPNNIHAPTFHDWDPVVQEAGYIFTYTDLLNRYYVAREHAELAPALSFPPDHYVLARHAG